MYLKGSHDLQISNSGVWRILKRLELNRRPVSQRHQRHDRRWKRDEQPRPGHRVQLDVKFIAALAGSRRKHDQFTAIHDCTRLRILRIYPKAQSADRDPVPGRCPGAPAVPGRGHPDRQRARVRLQLPLAGPGQGSGHASIKPRTPRLNGKVERSHRIDAEEFSRLLEGVVIDDTRLFNDKLREWEDFSNSHRPHGGLDGQTPDERRKQRTQARV